MKLFSSAVIICLLLFLLALFLGCTGTVSDKSALDEFSVLKKKFDAQTYFPVSEIAQNDYISQLSTLRGKSGGSAAKIIDAELYSVEAFYYLNRALSASTGIDFGAMHCSSKEVKNTISSIDLALSYQKNAVTALSALSESESNFLRENQFELVSDMGDRLAQLKSFFDKKC